jgi:hypothetical protein
MLQRRGAELTRFTGDCRSCSSMTRNPSFGAAFNANKCHKSEPAGVPF